MTNLLAYAVCGRKASMDAGSAGAPSNQAGEAIHDQLGLRLVALHFDES